MGFEVDPSPLLGVLVDFCFETDVQKTKLLLVEREKGKPFTRKHM
jgi:hypothetical protein